MKTAYTFTYQDGTIALFKANPEGGPVVVFSKRDAELVRRFVWRMHETKISRKSLGGSSRTDALRMVPGAEDVAVFLTLDEAWEPIDPYDRIRNPDSNPISELDEHCIT